MKYPVVHHITDYPAIADPENDPARRHWFDQTVFDGPVCQLIHRCAKRSHEGRRLGVHYGVWHVVFSEVLSRWYCWDHLPARHLIRFLEQRGVDVKALLSKYHQLHVVPTAFGMAGPFRLDQDGIRRITE